MRDNQECEKCESQKNYGKYQKEKESCEVVECCVEYVESVFFEVDAFPLTNGYMIFENPKKGMIVGFTFQFDEAMNDNVRCDIDLISGSQIGPLLKYPTSNLLGANTQFRGTNVSYKVDFHMSIPFDYKDQLKLTWDNASASDVTIMAWAEIRYPMEV